MALRHSGLAVERLLAENMAEASAPIFHALALNKLLMMIVLLVKCPVNVYLPERNDIT